MAGWIPFRPTAGTTIALALSWIRKEVQLLTRQKLLKLSKNEQSPKYPAITSPTNLEGNKAS